MRNSVIPDLAPAQRLYGCGRVTVGGGGRRRGQRNRDRDGDGSCYRRRARELTKMHEASSGEGDVFCSPTRADSARSYSCIAAQSIKDHELMTKPR